MNISKIIFISYYDNMRVLLNLPLFGADPELQKKGHIFIRNETYAKLPNNQPSSS